MVAVTIVTAFVLMFSLSQTSIGDALFGKAKPAEQSRDSKDTKNKEESKSKQS
jgi:hypothetical protein